MLVGKSSHSPSPTRSLGQEEPFTTDEIQYQMASAGPQNMASFRQQT